ncbi:MAG: glyoxalase, partial [bacterium]|nr:glyoxalase [bacterium]
TDIAQLKARLDNAGVAYTTSQSGRSALFCRDPDGNALEFVEG